MVDLIFAVDDATAWHQANIEANPSHYSGQAALAERHAAFTAAVALGLAVLGAEAVAKVQDWGAAKLYYNPYVTVDGMVRALALGCQPFLDVMVPTLSLPVLNQGWIC